MSMDDEFGDLIDAMTDDAYVSWVKYRDLGGLGEEYALEDFDSQDEEGKKSLLKELKGW